MGEKRKGAQSRGDCCEKSDEQETGNGGELEFRLHLARDSERKKGREKGASDAKRKTWRLGRKPCFAAAPKASAKLQYLSKTADFDVGKLFFLSCFFSFVSPNCKGRQFAFVGGRVRLS